MSEARFRDNVAAKYGVNAAIIAEYMWERIQTEEVTAQAHMAEGKAWCRCTMLMLTGYYPFLSRHMVSDAIHKLIRKSVIKKDVFNKDKFDKTSWYSFTEYGTHLMNVGK